MPTIFVSKLRLPKIICRFRKFQLLLRILDCFIHGFYCTNIKITFNRMCWYVRTLNPGYVQSRCANRCHKNQHQRK